MLTYSATVRRKGFFPVSFRTVAFFIILAFTSSVIMPPTRAGAQGLNLPAIGTRVTLTPGFAPAVIRGVKLFPDNPLRFDFIVDTGDSGLKEDGLKQEAERLIKYFLAALTVPEEDLWVNLSPYEKDRIIPEAFGHTEMGRDLLAQDYLLKQLTSSLMYPEDELGEEFWDRIYEKAYEIYGTTEIPVNTFNKIWIVPERAVVYENGDTAFVVESRLKVMLEQDYVAMKATSIPPGGGVSDSSIATNIIREVLIPEIEKEVNEGSTFAQLRQIYHSMILATWFKRKWSQSVLGKIYVDQNKITGVDVADKNVKHKIYYQYLEAFKQGVYNYIKEDYDPNSEEIISRKYFSGGVNLTRLTSSPMEIVHEIPPEEVPSEERLVTASVYLTNDTIAGLAPRGELAGNAAKGSSSPLSRKEVFEKVKEIAARYKEHINIDVSFLKKETETLTEENIVTLIQLLNREGVNGRSSFLDEVNAFPGKAIIEARYKIGSKGDTSLYLANGGFSYMFLGDLLMGRKVVVSDIISYIDNLELLREFIKRHSWILEVAGLYGGSLEIEEIDVEKIIWGDSARAWDHITMIDLRLDSRMGDIQRGSISPTPEMVFYKDVVGMARKTVFFSFVEPNDRRLFSDEMKDFFKETSVGLFAGGDTFHEGYIYSLKDSASSPVAAGDFRKGGIDLNPGNLELQIKGKGMDFEIPFNGLPCLDDDNDGTCDRIDMKELENMDIPGFTPVIFQITPLPNLRLLLGLKDEESLDGV